VKILIDMNLSPDWVEILQRQGHQAVHWTTVGDPRASDAAIMMWAKVNGHIVFTYDLDFGSALAVTHADGPSVLQVRATNLLPDHLESVVMAALRQHEPELTAGALVVVDEARRRVRILPI
jgi:predicted nuclease of predicted toxin-antitoxin system